MAPNSQADLAMVDNRVQVLKTVPVNLSLSAEHLDLKREQYAVGPGSGEGGAMAVVKAEVYTPVFLGPGVDYRMEGEEQVRVIYEPGPYDVSSVSHDQRSTPDSTFEDSYQEKHEVSLRKRGRSYSGLKASNSAGSQLFCGNLLNAEENNQWFLLPVHFILSLGSLNAVCLCKFTCCLFMQIVRNLPCFISLPNTLIKPWLVDSVPHSYSISL